MGVKYARNLSPSPNHSSGVQGNSCRNDPERKPCKTCSLCDVACKSFFGHSDWLMNSDSERNLTGYHHSTVTSSSCVVYGSSTCSRRYWSWILTYSAEYTHIPIRRRKQIDIQGCRQTTSRADGGILRVLHLAAAEVIEESLDTVEIYVARQRTINC